MLYLVSPSIHLVSSKTRTPRWSVTLADGGGLGLLEVFGCIFLDSDQLRNLSRKISLQVQRFQIGTLALSSPDLLGPDRSNRSTMSLKEHEGTAFVALWGSHVAPWWVSDTGVETLAREHIGRAAYGCKK